MPTNPATDGDTYLNTGGLVHPDWLRRLTLVLSRGYWRGTPTPRLIAMRRPGLVLMSRHCETTSLTT